MSEDRRPENQELDPENGQSAEDHTLGGYFSHHSRPPAFEGSDGHPYTVSVEVEETSNLLVPWVGYLVFPRWALTGAGIIGHLETPVLLEERHREDAERRLGALTLVEVRDLLERAIQRQDREETN